MLSIDDAVSEILKRFYDNVTFAVPAGPNRLINIAGLDNMSLVEELYSAVAAANNRTFI